MFLPAPKQFVFPPPFLRTQKGFGYPITPGVLLSFHRCSVPLNDTLATTLGNIISTIAAKGQASDYHCRTAPWQHQKAAFHFLNRLDCALLAAEMGLGKTKIAIDLAWSRQCRNVLVACPLAVCQVWRREIYTHGWSDANVLILDSGTSAKKLKQLQTLHATPTTMNWVVINYESIRIPRVLDALCKMNWDMIIADEAHRLKNHRSLTHKAMARLRHVKYRLAMTGTPIGQLVDVFGIMRWIDPGVFGEYYGPFAARFVRHDNPYIPQQITGYSNVPELRERFGWLTIRFTAADTLDMPSATVVDVSVELPAEARRIYEQLRTELVAQLEAGLILPSNALVKALRLQQIAAGSVNTNEGTTVRLHSAKTNAVADLLDAAGGQPVIVFARFLEDLHDIQSLCQKLGLRYAEISGERKDALHEGRLAEDVQVAGVQIQTGGLGIDLSRSHIAIFYSLGWSLAEYSQAIARLVRPSQRYPVTIYRILATRTIDQHIVRAINEKRDIAEYVLQNLRLSSDYDPLTESVRVAIMNR